MVGWVTRPAETEKPPVLPSPGCSDFLMPLRTLLCDLPGGWLVSTEPWAALGDVYGQFVGPFCLPLTTRNRSNFSDVSKLFRGLFIRLFACLCALLCGLPGDWFQLPLGLGCVVRLSCSFPASFWRPPRSFPAGFLRVSVFAPFVFASSKTHRERKGLRINPLVVVTRLKQKRLVTIVC